MFRRRLAVLGTAAVLALTGLGGSAMADEAPTGDAPAAAITCTTSDGHDIKLAEPVKGKVIVTRDADGVSALPEGEPGKIMMKAVPATPATPGSPTSFDAAPTAPASPTSPAETVTPGEAVESAAALPASPDMKIEGLAKTIQIVCSAEKPAE